MKFNHVPVFSAIIHYGDNKHLKAERVTYTMGTQYDVMKEADKERYVSKALAEVEAVKDNPTTWLSIDEFWEE